MGAMAWRMLRRELRAGELRLLLAALLIAAAAVSAVGFVVDRVNRGLSVDARQLLGGDLVLVADHPLADAFSQQARAWGLQQALTVSFPSMVSYQGRLQLVEIKAVGTDYPLRGQLGIADAAGGVQARRQGPQAGEVWAEPRLVDALAIVPGQALTVGSQRWPLAAILRQEPDRSLNLLAVAPRLMMALADLPASALLQPGARARYRLLLAGDDATVARYRDWATARLGRGEQLEDIDNARPEVRSALQRAERFLGLATLLTVILSAVALALAARRYLQRHLDTCAVLRCLGMTQGRLLRLHALVFAGLGILAIVFGGLLGFAVHFVLLAAIAAVFAVDFPWPGFFPLVQAALVTLVLLFGFVMPPLLQLARVPSLRVLRRELGPTAPLAGLAYGLGFILLAGLIVQAAGDLALGAWAVLGFSLAVLLFWGIARLSIALLGRSRRLAGFGWRHGLVSLHRHAAANAVKVVALALGLTALLLLAVTRQDLLNTWQTALPVDAPNRFIINIQPAQRDGVRQWFAGQGIAATLSPMVRARLQAINGRPVSAADYAADERAQRLVEREFNLSWRADLPEGNRIVGGRWFTHDGNEASVESGLAKTLGIALGDELQFVVAGVSQALTVTSLRQVEWGSLQANFFVLTPPGVLADAPASDISSFHLPAAQQPALVQLLAEFPNLTVIDLDALLTTLQSVIGQVVAVVQGVFVFSVLIGGVVFHAAFLLSVDERRHEIAVLRALGASRRQIDRAFAVELGAIGALAGLIAALASSALGQLIGRRVFELAPPFDPFFPLLVATLVGTVTLAAGWLTSRRLLQVSPLQALRDSG